MPDSLWLRAGRPLIIGHRGASAEAPENTLAAFDLALAQKADGFEFDVRLSADGVPVIIHDDTVDRTTNGTGRVADMTLAELKSLTIDGKHTIPTLDELFAVLAAHVPAGRILVVRHPHLWHLTHDPHGPAWNRTVGAAVAAAAERNGVRFFDAQDELAALFGAHPERHYWSGDMHLNFDGMRAYGELVGRELWRMIAAPERDGADAGAPPPRQRGAAS